LGVEVWAEQPSSTSSSSSTPKPRKAISVQLKSCNCVQNQMEAAMRPTPVREKTKRRTRMSPKRKVLPGFIFSLNIHSDQDIIYIPPATG
jgi:hypothetical protein